MAYFRIKEPNEPTKYIKSVDGANGTLEFTRNRREAMYRDCGFFADSDFEFIKFHFMKEYPEIQYMDIDDGYSETDEPMEGAAQINAIAWEAPMEINEEGGQPIQVTPQFIEVGGYAPIYEGIGVADVAAP